MFGSDFNLLRRYNFVENKNVVSLWKVEIAHFLLKRINQKATCFIVYDYLNIVSNCNFTDRIKVLISLYLFVA